MSQPTTIKLYIKPYCGWCHEAVQWLDDRNISYETLDVIGDRNAMSEMVKISGQSMAPVIEVDGDILADFDTGQLDRFWSEVTAD
ncbi:MAG: glutaredoxin family protein [Verrucomicrobia bacterium]|nr:glutaredoxin family protein [Verrucomicrobiota bacterium]MDA7510577.1 glutathione S-transferase N-terminal domain-containing protein [Verrucomicrobiota bacterium]MDA7645719.1 glutathione S-transferase N-terminal domain-containing protein [bacterium]